MDVFLISFINLSNLPGAKLRVKRVNESSYLMYSASHSAPEAVR